MSLWYIRIFFLSLCTVGGFAISQVRPEFFVSSPNVSAMLGMVSGFGFGSLLIAVDEMLKGFSLRAFSATSFGLFLGSVVAWLVDHSGLFENTDEKTRWLVRLALFLGFSYIGIVLAMRSNKEDFSLIIPYVRFAHQNKPDNLLLLDTSVIIDGRIADLLEAKLLEGLIVVPRFVLNELQQIGDSNDLVRLARNLNAKLFTNDYNLGKIAELQSVSHVNLHEVAKAFKTVLLPGEVLPIRIVREGKDKGQGVGYLNDGTMVVVNQGHNLIGQQAEVHVQSLLQTGAGVIVFADIKAPVA